MATIAKQRVSPLNYLHAIAGRPAANAEDACVARLRAAFAGARCIPVGRARAGIYLLVKNSVTPGRTEVLLSPYTIPDVVNMVVLAGGRPVFVDTLPRSTNMDVDQLADALSDRTACVLVTHYHVNQDRLAEIKALCAERRTPLFDDCAIAFGGSVDGQPLGAATDASVFSFSVYKFLNFFWGGLVTTRAASLAAAIDAEVSLWPRLTRSVYLRSARSAILYDLATRPVIFNAFTFRLLRRRAARSNASVELTYPRVENRDLNPTLLSRPSLAAFAEWARKIDRVPDVLAHRRRIAAIYRERLGAAMASPETSEACIRGSCFVNFPIVVDPARRDAIHREAMLAGFDLGKSLYPNAHACANFRQFAGSSEQVEWLVNSSLYLPTHFAVTEDYARDLAGKLQRLL